MDMLKFGNNAANGCIHERSAEAVSRFTARFPTAFEFFIKLLTDQDDIVVDTFAGSNTTGMVAEDLGRKWIAMESMRTI